VSRTCAESGCNLEALALADRCWAHLGDRETYRRELEKRAPREPLQGACLAMADEMELSDEDVARAMLAAGVIGVLIANRSTFAAEVAGCQAEGGAASCMAAAALVDLAGGSTSQAVAAASMALQNCLGMVCDPVAKRVEVPCLGKNVLAASNALACANMALADFDPVIPLDEVIGAADRVGRSLPRELRCTGLAGLSTTHASIEIEKRLGS